MYVWEMHASAQTLKRKKKTGTNRSKANFGLAIGEKTQTKQGLGEKKEGRVWQEIN